tara:strand:- start:368 stop:484 length:117 start_codon:yes stop_codon:yes gene_type:complete
MGADRIAWMTHAVNGALLEPHNLRGIMERNEIQKLLEE